MLGAAVLVVAARAAPEPPLPSEQGIGLPFRRLYPFEEIGNVSRGARLDFDSLGRLVVSRNGACAVLNDTEWIPIAEKVAGDATMQRLAFGPDGTIYHGAFGSWGKAELVNGRLEARPMMPASVPKWVQTADFGEIKIAEDGVYFSSLSGVVFWHRASNRQTFVPIPNLTRVFTIGRQAYAASNRGVYLLDPLRGESRLVFPNTPPKQVIDQVTSFDTQRVLIADTDGQLAFYDGQGFSRFPGPLGERTHGRVTAILRMADGNLAVAISGIGLYLVSETGQILTALTTPEYHRVTDLASREKGVLWIVTETGVEKLLYDAPLTIFGQRQGLPLSWPQIVRWEGRVTIASSGRLYEAVDGGPGEITRFQPVPNQPAGSTWGLCVMDRQLLVGTNLGVFARHPGGEFTPVLTGIDTARLVGVDGIVYVIGEQEITALRWEDNQWRECAPREPGVGYPFVAHASGRAAWLELGPNRAARVQLANGRIHVRLFEEFPWKNRHWVNIGIAGDIVALNGMPEGRIFFNEQTETLSRDHELGRILDRAPYLLKRFLQAPDGTIWATHDDGLVTIRQQGGQAIVDTTTYGLINDRFPIPQMLPGGDVWLSTSQSLYHVNRVYSPDRLPASGPVLVSFLNSRTNRELLAQPGQWGSVPKLPYEGNSLALRFFAGSYNLRQPPTYEFKLHRGGDSWPVVGNGSLLTLTDLHEGLYRLEVTLTDSHRPVGQPYRLEFEISPPWYRSGLAFALYALAVVGIVSGLMWWSAHHTRTQNRQLEKLVAERTAELRAAMQQLNEETRNAATLAERDRLAGEIHDSLQQGLSGLMLHLDATLKLPQLPPDVRSRLNVARNMVSFTRHEVQHAVWDMETPLLEGTDLAEALKKIAGLIGPGTAEVRISVSGRPVTLSSSTKHHLLRIAQEAITNAVRHAAARVITITLAYEPDCVTLQVADDGNGFVPNEVLVNGIGHFGLRGLRGRAGKIGGELSIQSAPGCGTTVCVVVRLAAAVSPSP
jgi:signal transduction histidine kinase